MNLILWIIVILLILGTLDLLTYNMPKFNSQLYNTAFVITYFLFTGKYYYGADIYNYHRHYVNIPSPLEILNGADTEFSEIGYNLAVSLANSAGLSLWWFTALVSTLFFYSIYRLFKYIPHHRTFALMILVVLEYNLIFAALRQCMAVSALILMVLCLWEKKYIRSIIWCVLCISFHKSGIFIAVPLFFLITISYINIPNNYYRMLMMAMILLVFLPLQAIYIQVMEQFELPQNISNSIEHHLSLGKQMQSIFGVYILYFIILILARNSRNRAIEKRYLWIVLAGLTLIAFTYQYFYLLNRVRSYFTPILIAYIFSITDYNSTDIQQKPLYFRQGVKVTTQAAAIVVMLFAIHTTVSFYHSQQHLKHNIYSTCTIFDLLAHDKKELQQERLALAQGFWEDDFMEQTKQLEITGDD